MNYQPGDEFADGCISNCCSASVISFDDSQCGICADCGEHCSKVFLCEICGDEYAEDDSKLCWHCHANGCGDVNQP